jgi:hypothetical protein
MGICDLIHLFTLQDFNSCIEVQPEELEDVGCVQIDDFLE